MNYPSPSPYTRDVAGGRDAGLSAFYRQTYLWMAAALTVTAVVAQLVLMSPSMLMSMTRGGGSLLVFFGAMGTSIYFSRNAARISPFAAANLLLVLAGLMGLMMAPLFAVYTEASVNRAFYSAAATFGAAALYGATTKRDMSQAGSFYAMGVMGALVAIVVNIFLRSAAVDFMISMALVVACTVGVAWENATLRQVYRANGGAGNAAIVGALSLYSNFINIFISLLRLMGNRRD